MARDLHTSPRVERAAPAGPVRLLPDHFILRNRAAAASYEVIGFLRAGGDGRSQYYAVLDGDGRRAHARVTPRTGGGAELAVGGMLRQCRADYAANHILPVTDLFRCTGPAGGPGLLAEIFPPCRPCPRPVGAERLRRIILALNEALHTMHAHRLLHLDVCPENVYVYNGTVVLGGFACAAPLSEDGHTFVDQNAGRPGYRAPEAGNGYVFTLSDYFSLGCTAAALYTGGHVYAALLAQGDLSGVNHSIAEHGLPLGPGAPQDLQTLCDALTHPEHSARPGYRVLREQWYADRERFCRQYENTRAGSFCCVFNGVKYFSPTVLTRDLRENWDTGRDRLFGQGVRNSSVLNAMVTAGSLRQDDAADLLRTAERDPAFDRDLGYAKFLHYLNADENGDCRCPIYWRGAIFENPTQAVARRMAAHSGQDALTAELLRSGFLSWKQENTAGYARGGRSELIRQVRQIEALAKRRPAEAYWWFMYRFAPAGTFPDETPDSVFRALCGHPNGFYAGVYRLLADRKPLGRLLSLGWQGEVEPVLDRLPAGRRPPVVPAGQFWTGAGSLDGGQDGFLDSVWEVYGLFDRICADSRPVREHCLRFGPLSYIPWLQRHLDLYDLRERGARDAAGQIRRARLDGSMSVGEQRQALTRLKPAYETIRGGYFASSRAPALSAYLGGNTGSGVFSCYPGGFFVNGFFGAAVPADFLDRLTAPRTGHVRRRVQ